MLPINCRRDENDLQRPPPSEAPNPNEPIEGPKGADPGPSPEPQWTPERESEPVLVQ